MAEIQQEYLHLSKIPLPESYSNRLRMREILMDNVESRYLSDIAFKFFHHPTYKKLIEELPHIQLSHVVEKVLQQEDLTLEESFVGMTGVLMATNKLLYSFFQTNSLLPAHYTEEQFVHFGMEFLKNMQQKEEQKGLTPTEVAGLITAAYMDVLFIPSEAKVILDTCGMGGDKGVVREGQKFKTVNVSTITSLFNSFSGIPSMKHGSGSNTSKVGSTEAIERIGELFNYTVYPASREEAIRQFQEKGFLYTDAHAVKTLHDLSHLIKKETINHIIGPMTVPIAQETALYKIMGINHNISPRVIARAYEMLAQLRIVNIKNGMVVAGMQHASVPTSLSDPELAAAIKENVILDEFSPNGTYMSVIANGHYVGDQLLTAKDFGSDITLDDILVANDEKRIHEKNLAMISGSDQALNELLLMNMAMCRFIFTENMKDPTIASERLRLHMQQALLSVHQHPLRIQKETSSSILHIVS